MISVSDRSFYGIQFVDKGVFFDLAEKCQIIW